MKHFRKVIAIIAVSLPFFTHGQTQNGISRVLSIPLTGEQRDSDFSIKKPAADLLYNGAMIDSSQAAELAKSGVDISQLNPLENRMWKDISDSTSNAELQGYPGEGEEVNFLGFDSADAGSKEAPVRTAVARVEYKGPNGTKNFNLGLSWYVQNAMMRSALLRRLGFNIPSPKYYRKIKVNFFSAETKDSVIKILVSALGIDMKQRGWILAETDSSVTFSSALLQIQPEKNFDLNWGQVPQPTTPANRALLTRFSQNRAFRALIIPFALVDIPESINRFQTRTFQLQGGYANLTYFLADSFESATREDVLWVLRRLQKLTLEDYKAVVKEAQFPAEIEQLVFAKLVARAKSTLSSFNLKSNLPDQNLEFTGPTGLVQKGKVMKEYVEGYPHRYSHGDRESPFSNGDFSRYLGIESKSGAINSLISKLNERLQLLTVGDHLADYQQKVYDKIIDHIVNHPKQPLYKEVTSWGGPIAGVNFNGSRHVATGTYYGSSAAVQLVDNISISANIGYFEALDGISKVAPFGGAGVSVVRDYTHVRPLEIDPLVAVDKNGKRSSPLVQAQNYEWKNLLVPHFMNKISNVLKEAEAITKVSDPDHPGQILEQKQESVDVFLKDLKDGEVFTISDSIALSAYLQAAASIDVLFGLSPFSFLNSITLGADSNRVIIRQIQFTRVKGGGQDGIQVYVREMKNKGKGLELNVNFFVNLIKIRAQTSEAQIKTDAFLIESELPTAERKGDLRNSLYNLFQHNDVELLNEKFQDRRFQIDHTIKEKERKFKFLWWRFNKFNEDHLVKFQYPIDPSVSELKPEDEEVTVFASKQGVLKGRDLLGFGFDTLNAYLGTKNIDFSMNTSIGDNPANSPAGKASWKMINSEVDLTSKGKAYPSVSIIQSVWGGWSMKRDKFLKLISNISDELKDASDVPIIDRNEFLNVKSLDFFRITAQLSITEDGQKKLQNLFKLKGDARLNQFLYEMVGRDQVKYQELYRNYMRECRPSGIPVELNGSKYKCLTYGMENIFDMGDHLPTDKIELAKWNTKILGLILKDYSYAHIMKFVGPSNYIYFVRINGFRTGDEDGDQEYFSNTIGNPPSNLESAGGIIQLYSKQTGIQPTELDRTLGGFQ